MLSSKRPLEQYPSLKRQIVTFCLPITEITLRISLPIEETRQRLHTYIQNGITHTTGSGILADHRRYKGSVNHNQFVLRGPYGHRKQPLYAKGSLKPDPLGSALDLTMRTSNGVLLFGASIILLFVGFISLMVIRQANSWITLPFMLIPVLFFYGILLINAKIEAEVLKDLLYEVLSDA